MGFLKNLFNKPDQTKELLLELKGSVEATSKVEDIEAEIKDLDARKDALTAKARELSKSLALEKKDQISEAIKKATWTIFFIHSTASGGHWSLSSEDLAEELKKICDMVVRYPRTIEEIKIFKDFDVWANDNYVSLQLRRCPPYMELLDKEPLGVENSALILAEAIKRAGLKIDQADTRSKINHEQSLIDGYKLLMDAGKGD